MFGARSEFSGEGDESRIVEDVDINLKRGQNSYGKGDEL